MCCVMLICLRCKKYGCILGMHGGIRTFVKTFRKLSCWVINVVLFDDLNDGNSNSCDECPHFVS